MPKPRSQRKLLVYLGLAMAASAATIALGCDDDGVTADCPAMPIVDENGQPVGQTKWNDPKLGPGGALNRWQVAAEKEGCATLPEMGGSAP